VQRGLRHAQASRATASTARPVTFREALRTADRRAAHPASRRDWAYAMARAAAPRSALPARRWCATRRQRRASLHVASTPIASLATAATRPRAPAFRERVSGKHAPPSPTARRVCSAPTACAAASLTAEPTGPARIPVRRRACAPATRAAPARRMPIAAVASAPTVCAAIAPATDLASRAERLRRWALARRSQELR
jgi:hypothetical protein